MSRFVWYLGLVCIIIIMISNLIYTHDLKQSAVNSFLNFDSSLGFHIAKFKEYNAQDSVFTYFSAIALIAHIGIFLFIFLVYKINFNLGAMMALILLVSTVFILHLINFSVIQDNSLTLSDFKNVMPFSGFFEAFKGDSFYIPLSITNNSISDSNVSLDLTINETGD